LVTFLPKTYRNRIVYAKIIASQSVPEMTYNVFSGTLNYTHFTSLL